MSKNFIHKLKTVIVETSKQIELNSNKNRPSDAVKSIIPPTKFSRTCSYQCVPKLKSLQEVLRKKKMRLLHEKNFIKKKNYTKKDIVPIIMKPKEIRTTKESKIIASFLVENFDYFRNIETNESLYKVERISSVLKYEPFKEGSDIITYGETGDKFYFLFQGEVAVYKPVYKEVSMPNGEFIDLMNELKVKYELKYNRLKDKNKQINNDLDKMIKLQSSSTFLSQKGSFFLENMEKWAEFSAGYSFGHLALLQKTTRNATIKALVDSTLLSVAKNDYLKILKEFEEKKMSKEIEHFKVVYNQRTST